MHISPIFYSFLVVLLSATNSHGMQSSFFSFDMTPQIPASERNYLIALHALKENNRDHALHFLNRSKHESIREITGQNRNSRLPGSCMQVGATSLNGGIETCTFQENNDENTMSSPSIAEWMRRGEKQTPDKAIAEIAALAEAIVTKMAAPQEEKVSFEIPEDRTAIVTVPKDAIVEDGRVDITTARKLNKLVVLLESINAFAQRKKHDKSFIDVDRVEYDTRKKNVLVTITDRNRNEEIVVYGDLNRSIDKKIDHFAYNKIIMSNKQYESVQDTQDHNFCEMLDYVIQLLGIDTYEHQSKKSDEQRFLYAPIKRRFLKDNQTIKSIAEYAYRVPTETNFLIKPMIYHRLLRRRPNKNTNAQFKAWLLSK